MRFRGGASQLYVTLGAIWYALLFFFCGPASARDLPSAAAWRWEGEAEIATKPVRAGALLAFATESKIWGVDAASGREVWTFTAPTEVVPDSPAFYVQEKVVFCTRDALVALDAKTGLLVWSSSAVAVAPRLCQGRLIVAGQSGRVQALDPTTGQSHWSAPESKVSSLQVDGTRILATSDAAVSLWDLSRGKKLWSVRAKAPDHPTLGSVALNLEDGLVARDPATGQKLWSHPGVEHYALSGERVLAQGGSELVALSAKTGRRLWTASSYGYEVQAAGSDLVLTRGYDGVEVWDQRTGRRLRTLEAAFPGTLSGEELLLGGTQGHVYRLSAKSGAFLPGYRDTLSPGSPGEARPGLSDGERVYLPLGSTLLALGSGTGEVVLKGTPELRVSVDTPVLPGKVRVDLEGSFLHRPEVHLYRTNSPEQVAYSAILPRTAGASGLSESLTLQKVQPGNYIVEAVSGSAKARTELTVTRMGVTLKLAPGQLLLRAIDAVQGSPLAGVLVEATRLGEALEPGLSGVTDGQGLLRIDSALKLDQPMTLRLRQGSEEISLDWTPQSFAGGQKIFLQTDRSLYRPGHEVFYQGLIGEPKGEKSRSTQATKVTVEIRDSADNVLTTQELLSDKFGAFSGSLKLGDEPPLGRYRLSAWIDPNRPASLPFEVQEYRKPPFEVRLKASQRMVSAGQTLHFELSARSFFGAPVPGAEAKVTVRRAELSGRPTPSSPGYHAYADFVSEETLRLGANGELDFTVPTEKGERDAEYLVDVEVTGPTGQVVEGSASGISAVAPYGVYLSSDSWVAYPGKPVRLQVETLDRLGRRIPAQVKIRVESVWPKTRLLEQLSVATQANGPTDLSWTPKANQGSTLRFSAVGSVEDEQVVTLYLYDESTPDPRLERELSAEKQQLQVGETARLFLKTRQAGPALLTVEGAELFLARPFQAKKGAQILEFPIEAKLAPGVTASVALLEDGRSVSESVELTVPDEAHRLDLKIEATQPKYRPGETAHLKLTATNSQGEPVDATASLAVVDEALLALSGDQVPAIHKFFFAPGENRVQTYVMQPRRPEVAGFQTVPAPTQVRKDFKDTAFWRPDVLISGGTAEIALPLPDNLTRWRATSRAATEKLEVGQAVTTLVTDLPLMVQAALPRYLVEGDSVDALAVVSNRTEASRQVKVALSASPGELSSKETTTEPIASEGQARVVSRLTVEENILGKAPLPDSLDFQVEASTAEGESDAERISVPILPFGSAYGKGAGAVLKAGERREVVFTRPSGLLKPKAEIRIAGSPLAVVEGALQYLAGFPYGCVEQTMSRFMPTVVAAQAMTELGFASKTRDELTPMVEKGLARLYHFQHGDGGWGWWEYDETNPYLTGYVISGLIAAKEAGYPVSETVLERGVGAAQRILADLDPARRPALEQNATAEARRLEASEVASELETRVYLSWALARAGHAPSKELTEFSTQADGLGTYSLALLTLAWQEAGAEDKSLPLVELLEERASETGVGVSWVSRSATPYGWTDDDLESTALALRAILAVKPESSTASGAVTWLLSQRDGAQWKSTRDTAQAVLALLDFTRGQPVSGPGELQVRWDGQLLQTVPLGTQEQVVTVPAEALVSAPAGGHRLELVPEGAPAVVSWRFTGFLKEGDRVDLPSENEGLRLTRTYVVEQPDKILRLNRVTPPEILRVKQGQEVEVELEFELPNAMQYLKLEDPRPAGFEVVPGSHGGTVTASRQEDRDAFSAFFFTQLPAGKHVVTYRLRAETVGELRSLPARVELMYRPSVYGASPSQRVEVAPSGGKL